MTLALKWINANMKKNPWTWGVGTAVIKTSVADLIAQKVIEKREKVDVRRNVVFSLFGFFYLGGFQFYLYNIVFPKLIPGTGARVVLTKLALDQCVHHPLVYFPSFYAIKEIVRGGSAKNAFDNYRAEIKESMFALWKVWVPGMFVCFAFVPAHLRIPYVSGVSFLWTTILSVMQSKFDSNREKRLTKPTIVAATPSVFSSSASLKE